MAAALLSKEFGFVLTLRSVDCCVHGASRWAVKEGRLGGVGALGENDLVVQVLLLALVRVVPGTAVQ